MSNNKQSSIELFIDQLEEKGDAWENVSIRRVQISIDVSEYMELKTKAKAMHKEEIVNTIVDCEKEHIIQAECYPPQFVLTKAEHYYNITFGGNNDIH